MTALPCPVTTATTMNERGYAVVPDFLSSGQLEEAVRFVREAVGQSGREYVGFDGTTQLAGTVFGRLGRDGVFLSLLHELWSLKTGASPPRQEVYHILRCLAGESGQANSMRFHYDSYVVTAVVPVIVPASAGTITGRLVLLPKRRPIRRSYPRNVADKILIESSWSQRRFKRRHAAGGLTKVELHPGHLVLFWGYETGHTNEACDPTAIRATAIYHFGEPHADAPTRRLASRVRRRPTLVP